MQFVLFRTEIFSSIEIACSYDNAEDGHGYDYFVTVTSDHAAQQNWSRSVFFTPTAPGTNEFEYLELIHNKIIKHLKKKIKKKTSRLLRNVRYKKLYDAQEGICYLCQKPLSVYDCTIDHVQPRSKEGKNSLRNMLLTHSKCNHDKGNRTPSKAELDYLEEVNLRVKKIQYLSYKN